MTGVVLALGKWHGLCKAAGASQREQVSKRCFSSLVPALTSLDDGV